MVERIKSKSYDSAKNKLPKTIAGSSQSARRESARGKSTQGRTVWLLLFGVLGAILVVVISVLMTPLDDLEDPSLLVAPTPEPSVVEVTPTSIPIPPSDLQFPQTAPALDIEQTQAELKALATTMQSHYPRDPAAYHFSAQIYAELKQSAAAEDLWRQCISLNPKHVGPYVGLAEVLTSQGRAEEALRCLETAQEQFEATPELLLALGKAYEDLGKLDEALQAFAECTQQFPDLGTAWLALGRVQNQLEDFPAAEASIGVALEIDGPSEPALFALITSLVRQKRSADAEVVQGQMTALRATPADLDSSFQQQYDESLRRIAASMYIAAASLEEEHGEMDLAAEFAQKSIALDPLYLQGYMSLSAVYRKLGRMPDVIAIQQRLVELQPNNLLNYLNLASVSVQAGSSQMAELALKEAILRDPNGTVAQSALAQLYLAVGRAADAELLAEQVAQRDPSIDSLELLANVYTALGKSAQAQLVSEKAERLRLDATFRPR